MPQQQQGKLPQQDFPSFFASSPPPPPQTSTLTFGNEGACHLLSRRVRIPCPLLLLQLFVLFAVVAVAAVFCVRSVMLEREMAWEPPPLILVPGLLGSKLYVEAFGVEYPEHLAADVDRCPRNVPLRKSWISDELLEQPECELHLLSLSFDEQSGQFHDQKNVRVMANPPGNRFGHTLWPIQCKYQPRNAEGTRSNCDERAEDNENGEKDVLNDDHARSFAQFLMGNQLKYREGKTLFAAPYDWRHHQQSDVMRQYYTQLRTLVEHAVNGTGRKAVLFGMSMGNIVINRFLRDAVAPEWQKQYLAATINVAAPFGGTVEMIRALVDAIPMSVLRNCSLPANASLATIRSWAFPADLLPFPNAFGAQQVLVAFEEGAKTKNSTTMFTGAQMAQLLRYIAQGTEHLVPAYSANQPQPQPNVQMHCIYSVGANNTGAQFLVHHSDPEEQQQDKQQQRVETVWGDGDGAVNAQSLRVCQQWLEQGNPVSVKEFHDIGHSEILMAPEFHAHIADLLLSL